MTRTWVAATAALVVACGGGSSWGGQGTQSPGGGETGGGSGGGTGGGGEVGGACDGPVTVRLDLSNLGYFVAFELDVAGVAFETNGAALTPDWSASGPLVIRKDEPGRLATLKLPEGGVIDATVSLNRVRACLPEHCLEMDPCTSPLKFRIDFWKVRDRCTAVVRLDLASSVFADRERWAFLPRYSVHY